MGSGTSIRWRNRLRFRCETPHILDAWTLGDLCVATATVAEGDKENLHRMTGGASQDHAPFDFDVEKPV